MATVTAAATAKPALPRWAMLAGYLSVLVTAEVFVALGDESHSWFFEYGLTAHILLVFFLLFHATLIQARDAVLSALLVALSLASISRISNLAIPSGIPPQGFDILTKLALVSVPLVVSVVAVVYVQRLRPKDLGLGIGSWRGLVVQAGIGLTGIPLGLLEYEILRGGPIPFDRWIPTLSLVPLLTGTLVIFLVSGLSEELIFRGLLLKRAVEGFGARNGVLFVTVVFASLHIFFRSPVDLAFVFFVGLFYGVTVLRTRSLWGVILSHTLANVVLYLVAPFFY